MSDLRAYSRKLREAVDFLRFELGPAPPLALVLGSGLAEVIQNLPEVSLPYSRVPHFPESRVAGHPGRLAIGRYQGKTFCALLGRVHFYEGWPMAEIVLPVRVLALWGVQTFIITNAAGAINEQFRPGDLMVIRDHINLLGDNPLSGPNLEELGERFPDMTHAYDSELVQLAQHCARRHRISLREGVYLAVKGPSYETPAEIRAFRTLGADAVGMSTVPEVIALRHMERRVLGLSCLTNLAAGMGAAKLNHRETLEVAAQARGHLRKLLLEVVDRHG